jgi:hypothetical protein
VAGTSNPAAERGPPRPPPDPGLPIPASGGPVQPQEGEQAPGKGTIRPRSASQHFSGLNSYCYRNTTILFRRSRAFWRDS